MTLPASVSYVSYIGSASAGPFTYPFKITTTAELEVKVDGVLKTAGSHFSVTGVGVATGGTITFLSGFPATGAVISIRRVVLIEQTLDLVPNTALPAEALETRLDHLTKISQQQQEQLSRIPTTLQVGTASGFRNLTMPAAQATKLIGWDAEGDGLTLYDNGTNYVTFEGVTVSTHANLPAGAPGLLAYQTDGIRGLWEYGTQWAPVNLGVADVKQYGALGNGIADDTTAIQAAMDAGKTVFFPDGDYICGPVTLSHATQFLFGTCTITANATAGDMFTSSGYNCSFIGVSGRETRIYPLAGYSAIVLKGNWTQGGTGLTERAHFYCEKIGFDGGVNAIKNINESGSKLQWRYIVDDCDFVNQTSFSLLIARSVFYTFVSHCYARDVYGFADVYDDTETKFYGNAVEVKGYPTGGPAYRLRGCHRVVIEAGDIVGGRNGNPNPDILIIPDAIDGSTTPIANSSVITIVNHRFGPEFDQSLLIRPKIIVYNADNDVGAISLRIEDCWFYANNGMEVTSATRTSNIATVTVTLPSVGRYDGETYTSHHVTVGSIIRLTAMPGAINDLNGAFEVTAVTGDTISFVSVGANFSATPITNGLVVNANNRCIYLHSPVEASIIRHNTVHGFRYFVDTTSDTSGSPYGASGTSIYEGNILHPMFGGNTLDFTSQPRDFNIVRVGPNSALPDFDAAIPPIQAVQTQNRIQESDLDTWDNLNCTVTGPTSNGMGAQTAWQIERDFAGSGFSSSFNSGTKKHEYTIYTGISKLLDMDSSPRQGSAGVIQLRARAVETAELAQTCVTVGIIDKTNKEIICLEILNLLPDNVYPAKTFRIPFRYRNGFDYTNTHIFIIPGHWYSHKATVIVDQVSVADVPCDFVRTVGAERVDVGLGNIWRRDIALGGLRTVPGVEGPPVVTLSGTPLGTGGSVTIFHSGTSMAGTLQLNTGTGAAATGSLILTVQKTLINPVILCSLEDAAGNDWVATAQVKVASRITGTPNEYGFELKWTNAATALLDSTSNCMRINYWIIQLSDTGVS